MSPSRNLVSAACGNDCSHGRCRSLLHGCSGTFHGDQSSSVGNR